MDSAAKQYGRVATGMSKRDVIALLGDPASLRGSIYRWEAVASPQSRASMDVHFDRADKVVSVARTRVRTD